MNAISAGPAASEPVALIADVADSRQQPDFAGRRDRVLSELSQRHRARAWVEFDYAVTAWDEFQGLIVRPADLPRVVWDLWRAFQPWSLRLAVGFGAVERVPGAGRDDPLNRSVTGEAFHRARAALEALDSPRQGAGRVRVRAEPDDDARAAAANAVLRLADALAQDITERQWELIDCYERLGKQSDVAAELSVSDSTISRGLAGARYWEIRASLDELGELVGGERRLTRALSESGDP